MNYMIRKFDKSKIMKNAWYIYRHSFIRFSDALREAWRVAKKEAERQSEFHSVQKVVSRNDTRISHVYRNCQFGRNDWTIDYQNDARVAIGHALKSRRLNNQK